MAKKKEVTTKSKKEVKKTKTKEKGGAKKSGIKKAVKKDIGEEINKLKEDIGSTSPKGKRKGKTELILKMAEEGHSRKEIIDKLQSMNPELTRKSTAGLVSHVLGRYNLRSIPAGIEKELERRKEKKKNSEKQNEQEADNPVQQEKEIGQEESIIITEGD